MHMVGKQSIMHMLAVSSWARDESLLGVAFVVFSSLRPRMELIRF